MLSPQRSILAHSKPSSKSSLFQWTAMGKSIVNNVVPKKGKLRSVHPKMGGQDLPDLLQRHLVQAAARSLRLPQNIGAVIAIATCG